MLHFPENHHVNFMQDNFRKRIFPLQLNVVSGFIDNIGLRVVRSYSGYLLFKEE